VVAFRTPSKSSHASALTPGERATLSAVCDTLFPRLPDSPGALGLSVPERIEETLPFLGRTERYGLRLLLRLLDRRAVMFLTTGRPMSFNALSRAQRERILRRMSVSLAPSVRSGFQGLFRLSAFHCYSAIGDGDENPLWTSIGYTPSHNPPAAPSPLVTRRVEASAHLDCDVCIIGAGAGGSVAAAVLASRGHKVIVLEAGSDWQSEQFDQREAIGTRELYLDRATTTTSDLSIALLAGAGLGGGTTVNWQSCFRTPDAILEEWADSSGCRHFSDGSFGKSLDNVWGRLAVSRAESRLNANNGILERGCSALGYRSSRIARNSLGCDLTQCGNCVYGCRHGGKQTAAVTFLRDAQETGNLTLVARCTADRLIIAHGRVSGVSATALGAGGKQHPVTVNARVVVVACGALHTPALLMRSSVELAALGRNLFIHPTTGVTGVFDHLIEAWRGPPQTVVCDEFAELRGRYGYRIETAVAHPGLLAAATPWLGAVHHRQAMQQVAHRALLIVLVRDRAGGRVIIDSDGRPRVRYQPRRPEREMLRHGMATGVRILDAAGATSISTVHTTPLGMERGANKDGTTRQQIDELCRRISTAPVGSNRLHLFSAHQMGTCRMGRDSGSAVCDANGEVFGVRGLFIGDASAFPLSSGVNPMITVMAMAHHTARRIADTW
jgi:choline dehydrogenase-like flavoprotein